MAYAGDREAVEIGTGLRTLNQQAFTESMRRLSPADTTAEEILLFAGTRGKRSITGFRPVYNASTKQLEIWEVEKGKNVRPTDQRPPVGMARDVKAINRQLNAEYGLREFSGNPVVAGASEAQIKQTLLAAYGTVESVNDQSLEETPPELMAAYGIQAPQGE